MGETLLKFFVFVVIPLMMCGSFALVAWYARRDLARQIAEGTHKVESTTNDFGTMEWRVVEVEEGMEE